MTILFIRCVLVMIMAATIYFIASDFFDDFKDDDDPWRPYF